jgi:hypothetical protein
MNTFLEIVIIGAIVWILIWGYFYIALPKQEKIECEQWIKESQIYPNYYLTEWQKEQCEHYGYDVSKILIRK